MAVPLEETSVDSSWDEDSDDDEDDLLDAKSFDYNNKPQRNRLNAVIQACVQEVCLWMRERYREKTIER